MARMNVVFEDALLDEMRHLIPARQRSGFIEDAVRARLQQVRQEKAAQAAAGAWSSEDREDPVEEIRKGRQGWEARRSRAGSRSDG